MEALANANELRDTMLAKANPTVFKL